MTLNWSSSAVKQPPAKSAPGVRCFSKASAHTAAASSAVPQVFPKTMHHHKHKPQHEVAAKSKKPRGRSQAANQGGQPNQSPEIKIYRALNKHLGTAIYREAMEMAVEHLYEAGMEATSLFDPTSGELTPEGSEAMIDAVEAGWERSVECSIGDLKPILESLLSDRTIFDHITAYCIKRGYIKQPQIQPTPGRPHPID
jgi:hypothetical protein